MLQANVASKSAAICLALATALWTGALPGARVNAMEAPPGAAGVAGVRGQPQRGDLLSEGVFLRDSVAFDGPASDGQLTPAEANERRSEQHLICAASDGAVLGNEGPDNVPIFPWCHNGAYLFGYSAATQTIYRQPDDGAWEVAAIGVNSFASMFALADGTLVYFSASPGSRPYWSADDGLTWTRSTDSAGNPYVLSSGVPWPWSLQQSPQGTVIVVEYGGWAYEHRVHRSTDACRTFEVVQTQPGPLFDHAHAVGYHAGTQRWIYSTGDGPGQQFTFVSADDGRTWTEYVSGAGSNDGQVVRYLDTGHPTRLVTSSDSVTQIGWIDLTNWDVGQYLTLWDTLVEGSRSYYSYLVFEHAGLYYACQWDIRTTPRQAVISVSPDLVHWVTYHRIDDVTIAGAAVFAGFDGRKLHLALATDGALHGGAHLVLSPAQIAWTDGALIEPGTTNLYDAVDSSLESTAGWSHAGSYPTTFQVETAAQTGFAIPHGERCFHVQKSQPGSYIQLGKTFASEIGRVYQLRCWIRGRGLNCQVRVGTPASPAIFGLNPDRWSEVVSLPYVATAASTVASVAVGCRRSDGLADLYVDAWQVEDVTAAPGTRWQIGGTPRAAESLSIPVTWPADWTLLGRVRPIDSVSTLTTLSAPLYLLSIVVGSDAAEVYYDPQDDQLKLELNRSGTPTTTGATFWQREGQLILALRKQGDSLRLSLANGQPVTHTAALAGGAGLCGEVLVRTGDRDGLRVLPMMLADVTGRAYSLSDAEVEAAMAAACFASSSGWCNADFDHDGDVDAEADEPAFLACLAGGGPNCGWADLNQDGVVDNADYAVLVCELAAGYPDPQCCLPRGACCVEDCRVVTEAECQTLSGRWLGAGSTCTPDSCPPPLRPGDLNCDGAVDFGDINPFVQALGNPAAYAAAYPDCPLANRDINGDGSFNFGDLNPFVMLLCGQ